jgi:hypothetical protein
MPVKRALSPMLRKMWVMHSLEGKGANFKASLKSKFYGFITAK